MSDHAISLMRPQGQVIKVGNHLPMIVIAGPCVLESRDHALRMSEALRAISDRTSIPIIYKSSFDKANRTSSKGERGLGLAKSLAIFEEVRRQSGLPILTDVHEPHHCAEVAASVDILQIPAFLCRQTDLLVAAGKTGKLINVKKGQFLAPWDMRNVVAKITAQGNENVFVCERGVSFGYNTLVSDFRSLPIMRDEIGKPIIFDATHSVQQPGGQGESSGGQRKFVSTLARAAVAIGVAGLFIETHQDPDTAPSDGPNMIALSSLEAMLLELKRYDELAKSLPPAHQGGGQYQAISFDKKTQ